MTHQAINALKLRKGDVVEVELENVQGCYVVKINSFENSGFYGTWTWLSDVMQNKFDIKKNGFFAYSLFSALRRAPYPFPKPSTK